MTPDPQWAIRTRGLTRYYGRQLALDQVDLEVPAGRVYGCVGPNGSGKTTAIAILLGLIRPSAGEVELLGTHLGDPRYPQALAQVGALVQSPAFYPHLSAYDNLAVLAATRRPVDRREIEEALDRAGLLGRARDRYQTYSLGMRQRLAIALALVGRPRLIILDEPTNGLDPLGIQEVRQLIRELGRAGQTIFLSSHLLHEVEQVCDEIGVVVRGRLVVQGRVEHLLGARGFRLRVVSAQEAAAGGVGNGADVERAAEVLQRLPWHPSVKVASGAVWVEAPPGSGAEMTRRLAAEGLWVSELTPVKSTLEQYFMELTTERNGQGGSPA